MAKSKKSSPASPATPPPDPVMPEVLQDWTPVPQCVDVLLAQQAWVDHGAALLLGGVIPTASHDSGKFAARSAEVLWAWCVEAHEAGRLPEHIVVVELGVGTGIHLRGLLSAFRVRALAAEVDWYDRLRVFATDLSPGVLQLVADRGVLAPHAERVRLGRMDARDVGVFVEQGTGQVLDLRGQIHAVWALYVLDTLPVDIVRHNAEAWELAAVQTTVRDPQAWANATGMTVAEARVRLQEASDALMQVLAAGQRWTATTLRTFPWDVANHPDADLIAAHVAARLQALGQDHPAVQDGVVHHHPSGALRALVSVAEALTPDGFALIRDVGMTTHAAAAEPHAPQVYVPPGSGPAVLSMPLDFTAVDAWMVQASGGGWHVAPTDETADHATRLLTRADVPTTTQVFTEIFAATHLNRADPAVAQARSTGAPADALEAWREALVLEPEDWQLLQDAGFSALDARQWALAEAMAARGLALNPVTAAGLWRLLASALALQGRTELAHRAVVDGLTHNPRDAGLHVTMTRISLDLGDISAALSHVGAALGCDTTGAWRETALQLLDIALRTEAAARLAQTAWKDARFG